MTTSIEVWADNATGTLGAPGTPGDTTLSVAQATGVFPTLSAGEVFHLVIDFNTVNAEMVEVTATSGSALLGWIFTLHAPGLVNDHNGPPGAAQVALVITKEGLDNLLAESVVLSTFTTAGDIIYGTGVSTITRLPIGTDGYVFTVVGGLPAWVAPGAPPTGAAGGDLGGTYPDPTIASIQGVVISGTPTAGDGLYATGASTAAWSPLDAAQVEKVFNAAGDLLVGTGSHTGELLAYGTNGDVLVGAGGLPSWGTPASVVESAFTAAGDLFVGTGPGTGEILPIGGTPGDVLTIGGVDLSGLEWAPGGGGGALTHDAQVLGSDVVVPISSTGALFTTASWGVGYWLVSITALVQTTAGATGRAGVALVANTATATFLGGGGQAVQTSLPSAVTDTQLLTFTSLVQVTVAGTMDCYAKNTDTGQTATVLQLETVTGYSVTGYTAVKIA